MNSQPAHDSLQAARSPVEITAGVNAIRIPPRAALTPA
jgi:hypothetical protein